jgi:hypothetical protein
MNRKLKTKTQKRANSKQNQLMTLVDRSKQLSDQTVVSLQDRFELKPMSSVPPSRVPRNMARQSYWYRGTYVFPVASTSLTLNTPTVYNFKLSDLPLAALQTVFDQYAIVEVVLRIIPQNNQDALSSTRVGPYVTVIDHDDGNFLTSISNAGEYSTALTTSGLIGQTRVVQPRVAIAAYSGVFTSFANTRTYIDCGSNTVVHYGIKAIFPPSFGQLYYYDVSADYIVHFRDTH